VHKGHSWTDGREKCRPVRETRRWGYAAGLVERGTAPASVQAGRRDPGAGMKSCRASGPKKGKKKASEKEYSPAGFKKKKPIATCYTNLVVRGEGLRS